MLFSMGTAAAQPDQHGIDGWLLLRNAPVRVPPAGSHSLAWPGAVRSPHRAPLPCPGVRQEHQGGAVLPDAPAADHHAPGDHADDPQRRARPGNSSFPSPESFCSCESCSKGLIGSPSLPASRDPRDAGVLRVGDSLGCEQFNSEAVLFRESERLDLRLWLRQVFRDRRPTPTASAAVVCGVSILMLRFVMNIAPTRPLETFRDFAVLALITQLAVILAPLLILTFSLTTNPARTLLLRWPRPLTMPVAVLLALALHPAVRAPGGGDEQLYPPSEEMIKLLGQMPELFNAAPLWAVLGIVAAVPQSARSWRSQFSSFRFRHLGRKWRAIIFQRDLLRAEPRDPPAVDHCRSGIVIGTSPCKPAASGRGAVSPRAQLARRTYLMGCQPFPARTTTSARARTGPSTGGPPCRGGFVAIGLLAWFSLLPVAKSDEELQREDRQDQGRRPRTRLA